MGCSAIGPQHPIVLVMLFEAEYPACVQSSHLHRFFVGNLFDLRSFSKMYCKLAGSLRLPRRALDKIRAIGFTTNLSQGTW